MRVTSGHLLGRQDCADPIRVTSGDIGSQKGVIVMFHIAWEWECAYMYKRTLLDTIYFKAVMTINQSELCN